MRIHQPHALFLAIALSLTAAPAGAKGLGQRLRNVFRPVPAQQDPLAASRWQVGAGNPRGTVIFLHGLGCNPNDPVITSLVRELKRQPGSYRVVSPWLRPVRLGQMGVESDGLHTMSDQLQRARQAIEQEPGKVVLMGHSFGGKAALQLAREYPNKVACVVGLAPSVNMLRSYWKQLTGERGLPPDAQRMHQTIDGHRGRLVQQLQVARAQGDREASKQLSEAVGYAAVMKDLVAYNEPQVEVGLRTPTLVLHGTEDNAVSIHYARRFVEQNPGAHLVELPDVGHGFKAPLGSGRNVSAELAQPIHQFINTHLGGN